ncbi:MAG: hypothetical protein ACK4QW_17710 [Alphaproteobacteria bacterium]
MRIALVNRFCPPDPAPTGRAMADLAVDLAAMLPGATIRLFTTCGSYRDGETHPPRALAGVVVTRIPAARLGRGRPARLAAGLIDGRRLATLACGWADTVISLTDPPLQGIWMGREARRRGVRWAEWTMDLYPEAFVAAGLAGVKNPFVRALARRMRRLPPDLDICLGPAQLDHVRRLRGERPGIVLPAGLSDPAPLEPPSWRLREDRTVLAYAGNLGEAHSAETVARLIERAPPTRYLFLMAPHGARANMLRQRIGGAPHIVWRDRLGAADLDHADVHIVSLPPQWLHVCVPSKALSAISRGRPILFLGPSDSDSCRFAGEAVWHVPEPASDAAIDAALAAVADPAARAAATEAAIAAHARLTALRIEAIGRLAAWLRVPH